MLSQRAFALGAFCLFAVDADPALDAYINQQMSQGKIGGMSVTVVQNDKVLWNNAYGSTQPGNNKAPKVNNDTAFMFASLSKTNIAVATFILYEKGLIDPKDDVNKYLNFSVVNPSFKSTPVTVHHLLTHTSSISDKEYDNIPIYMPGDPTISLHDTVFNYLASNGRWGSKGKSWNNKKGPGKNYDYSNIGACLMAYICEVIAVKNGLGKDFDDLVRTQIYAKLGAGTNDGGYFARDFSSLKPPAYAMPSQLSKSGWANCQVYSVMDYPTCDWRSSSLTYAKLLGMFINYGNYQGTQILKKETVQYMRGHSGFVSKDGEEPSNALWLYEKNLISGYTYVLGHDGSDAGISTYAYFNPDTGVGYVLLTNADMDGKGTVDDTSIAIGGHLMSIFDKKAGKTDIGRQLGISSRKQRRMTSKVRATGYPGSQDPPGCSGGSSQSIVV
jgi:CubicO group peptidase (beta-lactamase class C family)